MVVISSPEQTGSPHSKSWPPWTIVAKFIPTSGSKIAGASAGRAVDDAEHRRRDDVAEAGGAGRLDVEVDRVLDPQRVRVLLDLLPADLVGRPGPFLAYRVSLERHGRDSIRPRQPGSASSYSSICSTARKASCGTSTRPTDFIRFLPAFCFFSSFCLRVTSPP